MALAILVCWLGFLALALLFAWVITRLRYRVSERHLEVRLFGVPLRRLALKEMISVTKRGEGWSESWPNCFQPQHRRLIIRRSRGLFKSFLITPQNRYIFKTELERAIKKVNPDYQVLEPAQFADTGFFEKQAAADSPGDP